jgi:hypothetical protein
MKPMASDASDGAGPDCAAPDDVAGDVEPETPDWLAPDETGALEVAAVPALLVPADALALVAEVLVAEVLGVTVCPAEHAASSPNAATNAVRTIAWDLGRLMLFPFVDRVIHGRVAVDSPLLFPGGIRPATRPRTSRASELRPIIAPAMAWCAPATSGRSHRVDQRCRSTMRIAGVPLLTGWLVVRVVRVFRWRWLVPSRRTSRSLVLARLRWLRGWARDGIALVARPGR